MRWEKKMPARARGIPNYPQQTSANPWNEKPMRQRLVLGGGAGTVRDLSPKGLARLEHQLLVGDPRALFGTERWAFRSDDELVSLRSEVWGLVPKEEKFWLDPDRSLAAMRMAGNRIREVAKSGGRIAFATGYPGSLLSTYMGLASIAYEYGAHVLQSKHEPVELEGTPHATGFRWFHGVGVLARAEALLPTTDPAVGNDMLYIFGRPDLFVGDGVYAGAMIRAGVNTVVIAPPTQPVFGAAHRRTSNVTVVPTIVGAEPMSYAPLVEAAREFVDGPQRTPSAERAATAIKSAIREQSWRIDVIPLKK